jgi:hypothetical protein
VIFLVLDVPPLFLTSLNAPSWKLLPWTVPSGNQDMEQQKLFTMLLRIQTAATILESHLTRSSKVEDTLSQ